VGERFFAREIFPDFFSIGSRRRGIRAIAPGDCKSNNNADESKPK
jgi:hypothetical protein